MQKFVVITDSHGDQVDAESVEAAMAFTADFKPAIKIHMGDLFDFRPLRRGASQEEKAESMQADWTAGVELLHQWKPHYLLHGNHDIRADRLAEQDGICGDFGKQIVADLQKTCNKLKISTRPYHKRTGILKIGNLSFAHGYFHGVNAARQMALAYGNVAFGHIHTFDTASIGRIESSTGYAIGAMCNLDADYNSAQPNSLRQANGFAFGYINKSGTFQIYHAEKNENNSWLLPSGFKQY